MKNDTSFYRKRHVVLWKTTRRFMENKPSSVLSVEERIVFLYHLEKAMRKDNKGGAAVCKINCPDFIHGGLLSSKSGVYPLRRGMRGWRCYLQ